MQRRRKRPAAVLFCLTAIAPTTALGQPFPGATMELPAPAVSQCQGAICQPRRETWGHYREHWRRWPEQASLLTPADLSPFAKPSRDVPPAEVPDPRDESTTNPRQRRGEWSPAPDASGAGTGQPAVQPPSVPPRRESNPPRSLPTEPAEPLLPEADEPFFPSEPAPSTDAGASPALPADDDFFPEPSDDVDDILPPLDLDESTPPTPPDAADDLLDLGLGATDTRLKRYQSHTPAALRPAEPVVARSQRRTRAASSRATTPPTLASTTRQKSQMAKVQATAEPPVEAVIQPAALLNTTEEPESGATQHQRNPLRRRPQSSPRVSASARPVTRYSGVTSPSPEHSSPAPLGAVSDRPQGNASLQANGEQTAAYTEQDWSARGSATTGDHQGVQPASFESGSQTEANWEVSASPAMVQTAIATEEIHNSDTRPTAATPFRSPPRRTNPLRD